MGRRGALGQPPTAWRERRREVIPWCTVHHSPPLETQRLRKLLFYWSFGCAAHEQKQNETKDSPPGPPPGEGVVRSPSPDEQFPPSLGRPSQGLLHLRLPPGLAGAWTGWDGLSVTGSTTPQGGRLLPRRGSGGGHRGAPMAMSRLRGCSRSGSSSGFPPAHDVLDRLSLLLCCRKLLGTALDSVAEKAGLWHRSIQELYLLLLLHVSETQPEMALLDHKRGHRTTQRLCGHLRRSEREVRRSTQLM